MAAKNRLRKNFTHTSSNHATRCQTRRSRKLDSVNVRIVLLGVLVVAVRVLVVVVVVVRVVVV